MDWLMQGTVYKSTPQPRYSPAARLIQSFTVPQFPARTPRSLQTRLNLLGEKKSVPETVVRIPEVMAIFRSFDSIAGQTFSRSPYCARESRWRSFSSRFGDSPEAHELEAYVPYLTATVRPCMVQFENATSRDLATMQTRWRGRELIFRIYWLRRNPVLFFLSLTTRITILSPIHVLCPPDSSPNHEAVPQHRRTGRYETPACSISGGSLPC